MEKNSESTPVAPESETTASPASSPGTSPAETGDDPHAELRGRIVDKLRTVYDPEIPVDIYELGLIYEVIIGEGGKVDVKMTLTAPNCPVAGTLPLEVEHKVGEVEGVNEASVELVWEPQWTMERMSEAAKLELGMA